MKNTKSGFENSVKPILIGLVIGLAVLGMIFGVMYILNNMGGDGGSSTDVTVPVATDDRDSQEEDDSGEKNEDSDSRDSGDADDQSGSGGSEDYSLYIDEPESRLYSENVPIFFPDSDSRNLKEGDLRDMSNNQIQKVVNDIYARNGYDFKNPDFRKYYRSFSWYDPETNDMDKVKNNMNTYEKNNIAFLEKYKNGM